MIDELSEWQESVALVADDHSDKAHWREAMFFGLPNEGRFTLLITDPTNPENSHCVFADQPYAALFTEVEAPEPELVQSESPSEQQEQAPSVNLEQHKAARRALFTSWK
ncbi:hypothetical protein [Vibrio sp. WXL210]|uniref:hypothetical protein n=1 Tax=Vibrio sp. WXL210 TaxID=3450709 RepID=UPI003EC66D21